MQGFTSKYIFDGTSLQKGMVVLTNNSKIIDVVKSELVPSDISVINFGDGVIAPGFIDLQVNGCGGVLLNDSITIDTLEIIYQTWRNYGTTSFLPTLITAPFNDVLKALELIKEWFDRYGNRRGVLGIHLEGPFLSKVKGGIHRNEYIVSPDNEQLKQIIAYRQHFPIKITIAVEEFELEQIKHLIDNDIIVSVGHSNATYNTAINAINSGVSTATHIFNAMSGLTGRNPGVVGAILNSDIYAGMIVDMLHVDVANIKLLEKIKKNQVYLVTDAVTPTGTSITEFSFAGKNLLVKDGKCIDADGVLGGAYLTMNQAVKNCIVECDYTLVDTLKMASLIPAKVMNLDDKFGRIKAGYWADLIYMDLHTFNCQICG